MLAVVTILLASTTPALGFQSTQTQLPSSTFSSSLLRPGFGSHPSKTQNFESPSLMRTPSHRLSSPIATNDEVKDPSTLLSAKDDKTQQLGFLGLFGGIIVGSIAFVNLYNAFEVILPPAIFDPFYTILPCVLSSTFIAAGIAHFALEDTFTSFVPPKGTWGGLWQVPSPGSNELGLTYEQYHSFWSGIAEVLVGTWLFIATIQPTNGLLPFAGDDSATGLGAATIPAALMYLLTAAVTPANIYMYTHNPMVPRIPALPYPWGHAGRGLLQCALLAVFYKLTIHSLS